MSFHTDLPDLFVSKALLANLAPWVQHSDLSAESPLSSTMDKVTATSVEMAGLPLVKGGSYKIVEALKSIMGNATLIFKLLKKKLVRLLLSLPRFLKGRNSL